jgi:multisubunit Na+/H+ antiporter MnhG subunit
MDLRRQRHRFAASLGVARYPEGYEPTPGAGARRLLFGVVWLVVGVVLARSYLTDPAGVYAVVAAFWFVLAGLDLTRGVRLLQAGRHRPR